MHKFLLSLAIVFLFLPPASAGEWSFEELEAINGGCLETRSERVTTLGKAFEYCGCTTSHISQAFTVQEVIRMYESDTNWIEKREVKVITNYCNDVVK